jgi:hypothetical protein
MWQRSAKSRIVYKIHPTSALAWTALLGYIQTSAGSSWNAAPTARALQAGDVVAYLLIRGWVADPQDNKGTGVLSAANQG